MPVSSKCALCTNSTNWVHISR